MKKILFLSLVVLFAFSFVAINLKAGDVVEIKWQDAPKYMGKTVTVCGPIVNSVAFGPLTVLGMGVDTQSRGSVGIELSEAAKKKLPEDLYKGKTICVTGKIKSNPVGGPSIAVTDAAQVAAK